MQKELSWDALRRLRERRDWSLVVIEIAQGQEVSVSLIVVNSDNYHLSSAYDMLATVPST